MANDSIQAKDISKELYREYDFSGRVYRIDEPVSLFIGNTTHRVIDSKGVAHCLPSPGNHGCVLRWMPKDQGNPVQF